MNSLSRHFRRATAASIVIVAIVYAGYTLITPSGTPRFDEEIYDRLGSANTEAEVRQIMVVPPGDYRTHAPERISPAGFVGGLTPMHIVATLTAMPDRTLVWTGDTGRIEVELEKGKAVSMVLI